MRVLLDAAVDSPIDLLLRADNCTSIARLRQLIKIPGLHERAEKHGLNADQYEDLQAIRPCINWAHDEGHTDITTRKRGSFDHFFEHVYDVINPTAVSDKYTLLPAHPRLPGDSGTSSCLTLLSRQRPRTASTPVKMTSLSCMVM